MKCLFFFFILSFTIICSAQNTSCCIASNTDIATSVVGFDIWPTLEVGGRLQIEDLKNYKPGEGQIIGIQKDRMSGNEVYRTILSVKVSENLICTFVLEMVYDTLTNPKGRFWGKRMDIGYSEFSYGESTNRLFCRKQKIRLYPKNNIYTEKIELPNGYTLIIEDKVYLSEILLDGKHVFGIQRYNFD